MNYTLFESNFQSKHLSKISRNQTTNLDQLNFPLSYFRYYHLINIKFYFNNNYHQFSQWIIIRRITRHNYSHANSHYPTKRRFPFLLAQFFYKTTLLQFFLFTWLFSRLMIYNNKLQLNNSLHRERSYTMFIVAQNLRTSFPARSSSIRDSKRNRINESEEWRVNSSLGLARSG